MNYQSIYRGTPSGNDNTWRVTDAVIPTSGGDNQFWKVYVDTEATGNLIFEVEISRLVGLQSSVANIAPNLIQQAQQFQLFEHFDNNGDGELFLGKEVGTNNLMIRTSDVSVVPFSEVNVWSPQPVISVGSSIPTLAEVKYNLKTDETGADIDNSLNALITTAVRIVEDKLGYNLIERTETFTKPLPYRDAPISTGRRGALGNGAVTFYDERGVQAFQLVNDADTTDINHYIGIGDVVYLTPSANNDWYNGQTTPEHGYGNEVRVSFVFGAAADNVAIKPAIQLIVADLNDNFILQERTLEAVDALLSPFAWI